MGRRGQVVVHQNIQGRAGHGRQMMQVYAVMRGVRQISRIESTAGVRKHNEAGLGESWTNSDKRSRSG